MKQKLRNQDQGNLQIRLEQWEKLEGSYAGPEDLHGSSADVPICKESHSSPC